MELINLTIIIEVILMVCKSEYTRRFSQHKKLQRCDRGIIEIIPKAIGQLSHLFNKTCVPFLFCYIMQYSLCQVEALPPPPYNL
eukprot:c24584_g3_i1 orf=1-249(-)